ncbi:carbon-nitrogen hydrolase family protein [Nevskia sp.]|uniref:carbon-nitrogen hydrolase family protein n=1 Tax=Nevskia sp. TaxID=1929292 RepID=UPI0025CCADA9|nr:carbon-nitrogen hydrolase family protein [Nevskia sp.]
MTLLSPSPIRVATVQAAPAFLDLEAGVAKTVRLIEEAAQRGAKLIAFPECWLPGYPWWIWLDSPAWGMQFVQRYHQNSPRAEGPEMDRIRRAAREHGIVVVLGYTERDAGSLYIAQQLIDAEGRLIAARRKLKATHVERTVFGEGDGSDLKVHDTAIGRLGALCCWEHLNPLNKYIMYSQHEQIHVGAWPSFSVYEGAAYALGPALNTALSQVYAAEGQCFVLASCGIVSPEMVELLCDTPQKRQLLKAGGGAAMIFGPDGSPLCEPLPPDQEGLLIADIDLSLITLAKSAADPVGHYSRPDVVRVVFNPHSPQRLTRVAAHKDALDAEGPETGS